MRREGAQHGPYLCSQPPVHTDEDCPCGPTTKPVQQDDGSIDWLIVHKEMP